MIGFVHLYNTFPPCSILSYKKPLMQLNKVSTDMHVIIFYMTENIFEGHLMIAFSMFSIVCEYTTCTYKGNHQVFSM